MVAGQNRSAEHLQQPGRNAAPAADGYSVHGEKHHGALRRWVEANPELTGTLMKVAAVVAAVTVGLGTLAVALAAVLGPLAVIRLGFSVLEYQNVTFRYGSSNPNQQRVVLAGWRTTGTAATRACFIGQRRRFTYCAVVVFAPHGITDGNVLKTVAGALVALCGLDYPVYVLLL